ncbi:MAG: aspartate aminotransferase family protein [Rickettsiales bacterium]|nr:aspartate aminotransferase family protein [Rickettsiales bacterium]|tara:strand:- start:1599 stop:2867 length:1269 start_codon:yes stop_codon:yes gene_type:complete
MSYTSHNTENPTEKTARLVAKGQQYYVPNYRPREMILDRGEGARVFDLEGKDYIDLGSGIAVCGLGHHQQQLKQAAVDQLDKLWHTSNIFYTEPPILLAEALVRAAPFAERVYLCNSGAEANEAAIKLCRKYAADQGRSPEQRNIITFKGSFHGRTLATVTATAQPKYQEGFEPLPGGFVYCDQFNDEAAIRALVDENTCAILVEPVQGEGGVVPAKPGFLKLLRELCDEVGALLVVDEIQCGMMRTGDMFAHMIDGIAPDVMTLAKALGGGLPIGAMLVGPKAAETLQFGSHGSTFGGNPVMAAVALKSVELLQDEKIAKNVPMRAEQLREALIAINDKYQCFSDIRGRGLMIGAELSEAYQTKAGDISELARQAGVLVLVAGPNVCRFLPPLSITEAEMSEGLQRFEHALQQFIAANKPE